MLQDRYKTDKFFDRILRLTHEMDPVLTQIDQLLNDEALYQLIRNDLAKRFPHTVQTGRNSTPVEVVLRMMAVNRQYRLSYEQMEYTRCETAWFFASFVGCISTRCLTTPP